MAVTEKFEGSFKTQESARAWILGEGFKVSKAKFNNDCRAGRVSINKDRSVSRISVMQYTETLDKSRVKQVQAVAPGGVTKEQLEIRKLQLEIEKRERENRREDDKWMLKADAFAAMAAIISMIKDGITHHAHNDQEVIVYLANGDAATAPQVYEGVIDIVNKGFNEVAGARIGGMFDNLTDYGDETDDE